MYDPLMYQDRLTACERAIRWSREVVAEWQVDYIVDEVSLLFNDATELDSFVTWARDAAGLEHFNTVQDTMARQDMQGSFEVRFEFLRFKGADWRIEAMCAMEGEYPLHSKHLRMFGNACIVHASFKVADLAAYDEAVEVLLEHGLGRMAEYQNSYGIFSYWESLDALHYFKPRCNLRDL